MKLSWILMRSFLGAALLTNVAGAYEFEAPVRMKAGGAVIRVESPGYAAPCWADLDGDGKKDLLVGQFRGGRIKIYKNLGDGTLAEGQWLRAEGEIVRVDGIY